MSELESLRRAVVANPNSADIHYRLGVAFEEAGEDESALYHLKQATTLAPDEVYPVVALGQMYAHLKQVDLAMQTLRRAEELGASSPDVLEAVAATLHGMYKYREAAAVYQRVVALAPGDLEVQYTLGLLSLQLGDLAQAVACLETVIAQVRDNPEVWHQLCQAYERSGQLRQAVDCYKAMLTQGHKSDSVYNAVGRILSWMGRDQEAISAFQQVTQLSPDALNPRFTLARLQLEMGDTAGAHTTFRAALEFMPNRHQSHLFQGVTYLVASAYDRALGEFEAALLLDPNDLEAHSYLGQCLVLLEQPADAMAPLRKAVTMCPRHVRSLCGMGKVFQAKKQAVLGLDFFGQALQVNPECIPALRGLLSLCEGVGPAAVIDTLDEVLDALPQDIRVCGPLVAGWIRIFTPQNFELAAALSDRFVQRFPGDLAERGQVGLYMTRVHQLVDKGQHKPAVQALDRLLKVQPQQQDARRMKDHLLAEIARLAAPPPPVPGAYPVPPAADDQKLMTAPG